MNTITSTAGVCGAPIPRILRKDISEQDVSTSHFQGRGGKSSPRPCSFFPAPLRVGKDSPGCAGRSCRGVSDVAGLEGGVPCRFTTRK
jgi:hypothetical protein